MVAATVVLLGSCLDVETRIDFDSDLSGRMTLVYEIDAELWDMGVFDPESSVRALPVSRADFERTARRVDGVQLRGYSLSRGDATVSIEAELAFSDLDALNGIYAPGRGLISAAEDGDVRVYRQGLRTGEEYAVEDREFIETYFADREVVFEIRMPTEISSTSPGELLDGGRAARVSLDIVDFLTSEEPLVWEIRY